MGKKRSIPKAKVWIRRKWCRNKATDFPWKSRNNIRLVAQKGVVPQKRRTGFHIKCGVQFFYYFCYLSLC